MGDLAFSLLAAGLGFALLFATGRHLFATSVALPQLTVAQDAASPIAPAATLVAPARVAVKSVAVVRVAATSVAAARGAAILRAAAARVTAPGTVPRPSSMVARALPIAARAPAAQSRLARTLPPRLKPAKVAAPARAAPAVVIRRQRSAANVRHVLPAKKKLSRTGIVSAISARRASSVGRVRTERRPTRVSAPSIIEPPLGYEAQPAIVLAPGTAQLQLGDAAIPTIRPKRRH